MRGPSGPQLVVSGSGAQAGDGGASTSAPGRNRSCGSPAGAGQRLAESSMHEPAPGGCINVPQTAASGGAASTTSEASAA